MKKTFMNYTFTSALALSIASIIPCQAEDNVNQILQKDKKDKKDKKETVNYPSDGSADFGVM